MTWDLRGLITGASGPPGDFSEYAALPNNALLWSGFIS